MKKLFGIILLISAPLVTAIYLVLCIIAFPFVCLSVVGEYIKEASGNCAGAIFGFLDYYKLIVQKAWELIFKEQGK